LGYPFGLSFWVISRRKTFLLKFYFCA